jgi:predicted CoA-substrate-specific enzyme activase
MPGGRPVAGIDVGAATAKAVVLRGDDVLASSIVPTGSSVAGAGQAAMQQALDRAGLALEDLEYVVSTGYGRRAVPFASRTTTEITCHAAGARWLIASARTIIDIGGQDCKVIGLHEGGTVSNFAMNDRCAAGTGRFLEVMAAALEIELDEMGPASLRSVQPCTLSSTCTVFAESEMISLRAEGASLEDMIAGIHSAMARRVAIMGTSVGYRQDVVFTGGVAKNIGIKQALEREIEMEISVPQEAQIVGALGAALLAKAEVGGST